MPERAINTKSATGCLLVLIPAALTMSALFVAWPVILGVTLLIAGGNVWQSYEWSKTAQSIDPIFQQLIVQNRGEISPIDLSLRANVSGKVSQRYLAIRADEFGTGSRQHPDRGQVYYFVSISTLGSIFDDSDRDPTEVISATSPVAALAPVATPITSTPEVTAPVTEIATPNSLVESAVISPPAPPTAPVVVADEIDLPQLFDAESALTSAEVEQLPVADAPTAPPPNIPLVTIIQ